MTPNIRSALRACAAYSGQSLADLTHAHGVARKYVWPRRGGRGVRKNCRPNESNANALDARALEMEALP